MDTKKVNKSLQRLSVEYKQLIHSINRTRTAVDDIQRVKTEDEGDLAAMSHDRELLCNLNTSEFARLRAIQDAIKAIERNRYGECVRCTEKISDRRLEAMPWATTCITCQVEQENEKASSQQMVRAMEQDEAG